MEVKDLDPMGIEEGTAQEMSTEVDPGEHGGIKTWGKVGKKDIKKEKPRTKTQVREGQQKETKGCARRFLSFFLI